MYNLVVVIHLYYTLQRKDSLLSSFLSHFPRLAGFVIAEQSKKFASHSAILQDSGLFTDPTTVNRQTEVLIREDTKSEHPAVDLTDTLPWIGPNATRVAAEHPKPVVPMHVSHWHQISARPKTSTRTYIRKRI